MLHVGGCQFAKPSAPDGRQDWCQDVLVLLDRLGRPADQTFLQPVLGGAPDGVVRVCLNTGLNLLMELLQPVLDHALRPARDLAPNPLAVGTKSKTDDATPPSLAIAVPGAVTARGIALVLEEDAVLTPTTSCAHEGRIAKMGAIYGGQLLAMPRHNQRRPATYPQLDGLLRKLQASSRSVKFSMVRRRSTVRFRKGARQRPVPIMERAVSHAGAAAKCSSVSQGPTWSLSLRRASRVAKDMTSV